jgi:hypothetical protein
MGIISETLNMLKKKREVLPTPQLVSSHDDFRRRGLDPYTFNHAFFLPTYPREPIEFECPMIVDKIFETREKTNLLRETPSTTSSLFCGSTVSESINSKEPPKPNVNNDESLSIVRTFLTKWYSFILDVTEVRIRESRGCPMDVEIHITVSPLHSVELMNPVIEKKVRNKINKRLTPLLNSLFPEINNNHPLIIFSPTYSDTILELI